MIYRVDLHVHTLRGSADPALCLSELVRAARQAGLDAIAITDTDYCTPVPIELRGVVLIPGCEVSTLGGSILPFLPTLLPKQTPTPPCFPFVPMPWRLRAPALCPQTAPLGSALFCGPRSTSAPAWAAAMPAPPESWVRFTRRSPAPAYPALS